MPQNFKLRNFAFPIFILVMLFSLSSCVYNSQVMKEAAREHYALGVEYYDKGEFNKASAQFKVSENLLERDRRVMGKLRRASPEAIIEIASPMTNEITRMNRTKRINRPEYIIGPEDILSIYVWQNKELSRDVVVRPDGRISFPLLDDVEVEGMTIPQLDGLMTEKLKTFIRYPEVSVSIKRLGGKRVIILGEVRYPGLYQVTGTESMLEAVAMAQGFTSDALASSMVVIKGVFSERPRVIRASANRALAGMGSQNVLLESGDVIFVPKKPISDLNWLATEVGGILSTVFGNWAAIKPLVYIE